MVVPQIDVHRITRRGLLAPQFTRRKPHRIHVLGLLAEKMGVRVGKTKTPWSRSIVPILPRA